MANGVLSTTMQAGDAIEFQGFTVTVLSVRSGKVRLRFVRADGSEFEAEQEEIREENPRIDLPNTPANR